MRKFKLLALVLLCLTLLAGTLWYNRSSKPRVLDCFLFFNELDVLDIRLSELYEKVDQFILVESTRTFQNKPKPLYFAANKERYSKYLDKIVHVVVDEFPVFNPVRDEDYWEVEIFQRDQIIKGLNLCKPRKKDIIIITDVDEIVRKEGIDLIVKAIHSENNDIVFGEFDMYQFFLNRHQPQTWNISVATSWGTLSKFLRSCQGFRDLSGFAKGHAHNGFHVLNRVKRKFSNKKWSFANLPRLGWHFSSLGGHRKYLQKLESYAHVSANKEESRNIDHLKKYIESLQCFEISEDFPHYVLENKEELREKRLIDSADTIFQ